MNDISIKRRLRALHVWFALSVCTICIFVAMELMLPGLSPYVAITAFCAIMVLHLVLVFALASLASSLGRSGTSVFLANFLVTPVLLPISYVRVCLWARRHLADIERQKLHGEKASRELDLDALGSIRVTRDDYR